MKHLTDEQFSALLDDVFPAAELAACEAHLADCDSCRARLAEADALDDTLEQSLTHDPGEAYFESFADRVAARIAAQQPGAAARSARPERAGVRSFWGWLVSPRGLSLAGSTAALLLVAGLAWVRFHERGGDMAALRAPSSLRTGSPLRERSSAPEPTAQKTESQADAVVPAPVTENAAPPAESGAPADARPEAERQQQSARMREVRPNASGNEVPVLQSAPSAATRTRDDGTTTKLGLMKQRSAAPAAGGTALKAAPAPAPVTQSTEAKRSPAPTANDMPATRSLSPSPAEGVASASQDDKDSGVKVQALAPCGSVRDSRGRAVSGAQIMVVNDITRTARTGPDGSFCLPRLEPGDVVSVLRVGYEPVRVTVGDASPLAVVMEPVGTLGPEASKGLVTPGAPSAQSEGFTAVPPKAQSSTAPRSKAPAADRYAGERPAIRDAVASAREAARVARRDRSAPAMDAAAIRWDAIAAIVTGTLVNDAQFQALSLRRESLSVEPTSDRLTRFNVGLQQFLVQAPHDLPEYATALRWKSQFSPTNKALYR